MSGTVLETLAAAIVFFGLTLPPGLWALRLRRVELSPLARLAIAMPLGLVLVLSALALELAIGGPWLVLPLALGSCVLLRRDRPSLSRVRSLAPEILTAMLLGGLAFVANVGDVVLDQAGLSVRVGFDVSDRAFYGTVAQELERAPIWRLENPAFAPLPLQYSYLPSLAGVLLHRYGGVDPLTAFGTCLPLFGVFYAGMSAAALAQTLRGSGLLGRLVPALLVALGGDLSFAVARINETWLERTRLFFVFYSFSAESLLYNPWMFGVPIMLTTILCLSLPRSGPQRILVIPTAILLAGLSQTKIFAFIPLWLAVAALGLYERDRRLARVAALSLALAAPGMLLVAVTGAARGGAPLALAPFAYVQDAIGANPSLADLGVSLGFPLTALVVLLGGFGFRLLGLKSLAEHAAAKDGVGSRVCALTMFLAGVMALLFVGRPTRLDGVQFMVVPLVLMWVFAGSFLGAQLHRGGFARFSAIVILGLCVVTPLRYISFKLAPALMAPAQALDGRRFLLSPTTIEACRWLRAHSSPTDRLVLPLAGDPEDRGGLKPLYVGLLASRRLVAEASPSSVSASIAADRQAAVLRLYETSQANEGEALLDGLDVAWVWEDASRPLRFESTRLVPRVQFGRTRLLSFKGDL